MNILGLSTFADASAAIVRDGNVICAVEEERLNRVKHYEGMPWLAIRECLEIADMSLGDIDVISIGWNPFIGWNTRILEAARSAFRTSAAFRGKVSRGGAYAKGCGEMLRLRRPLEKMFPQYKVKQRIVFVEHHHAHAASAFLASPYETANIIVADGVGEYATISFFTGEGKSLRCIEQIKLPHSLGHLYAAVTGFLGFRMTHDEGKVMALAAFGDDRYRALFSKAVHIDQTHRTLRIDTRILDYHGARNRVFPDRWLEGTGMEPREKNGPITQQHKDLACSVQRCIEEAIFALLEMYFEDGRHRPLCAAGGLFLNSVMNGNIVRKYNPRFFVPPAAGDNGVSLGSALYLSSMVERDAQRHPLTDVYLGRRFEHEDIEKALKRYALPPRRSGDIFAEAADSIAQGKVIGWFRGRMEFGPRALGGRSIMACPTMASMKDIVNLKAKHREAFRPFAGSIMLEDVHEYFEDAQASPFMLKVFHFRDRYREVFPAICHVDGSCRIQTVTPQEDLYRLLQEMKKRTGYGVVLNTSMNVAGEPIVHTPDEAIGLMRKTDLDIMILENYVIGRLPAH